MTKGGRTVPVIDSVRIQGPWIVYLPRVTPKQLTYAPTALNGLRPLSTIFTVGSGMSSSKLRLYRPSSEVGVPEVCMVRVTGLRQGTGEVVPLTTEEGKS